MALVTVEVADLAAASHEMTDAVAAPLLRQVGNALGDLSDGYGMAGDDPAGSDWASGYDRVAPQAVCAAEDVINACYRVSAMLGASARNYANAEIASTVRGHQADSRLNATVAALPGDVRVDISHDLPSASAGSGPGDLPSGWHFIAHRLGGYVWPNGHQDRLRAAAHAWRASAAALESHAFPAALVDIGPLVDNLPEGPDISLVCNGLSDHLHAVARAHRGLGEACSQLATHIDKAHSQVEHELGELLAWTAGIQTVGAVAAAFTLGVAEAPTQVGEAARIATTVSAVINILRDFVAAVRVVLAEITPLAAVVGDVRAAVAWLRSLRIVEVEVAAVPGLRVYEVTRIERAGGEAASTTEVAQTENSATNALAAETQTAGSGRARWAKSRTLRKHFDDHGADFGCTDADEYADQAVAFYDRGRAEGLPTKIDEAGDVRIYDPKTNTFGSYTKDGKTRTFYKPSSGARYWNRQPGVSQ